MAISATVCAAARSRAAGSNAAYVGPIRGAPRRRCRRRGDIPPVEGETRIRTSLSYSLWLTADSARLERRALYALLDAIEIAARAIGCRRITSFRPGSLRVSRATRLRGYPGGVRGRLDGKVPLLVCDCLRGSFVHSRCRESRRRSPSSALHLLPGPAACWRPRLERRTFFCASVRGCPCSVGRPRRRISGRLTCSRQDRPEFLALGWTTASTPTDDPRGARSHTGSGSPAPRPVF